MSLSHKCILVVDDEPDTTDMFAEEHAQRYPGWPENGRKPVSDQASVIR